MVNITDDYLFCEPLLTTHLRERIPELACVGSVAGLEQLAAGNIPAPSAWVFYLGDQISGTPAAVGGVQNRQQFVTQLWAVVVAVYFADGPGRGGDIAGQAGRCWQKWWRRLKAGNRRQTFRASGAVRSSYRRSMRTATGFIPWSIRSRSPPV